MKQVLFVDDESKLLDGLKRMLRPMRHEWSMTFVTSAEDALKMLEQTPFDVVVSDMRMPGMDGAQLLNEVQRRYPHIVRIVLSGHSDQEMIYRSIGATHQYLAKPCDAEVLKTVITRACALRTLLGSDSLRALVTAMRTIPSRPSLYLEIKQAVESPSSSLKTIAAIVSKDMGMTAKILQLVNSAYFGVCGRVSTAEQAVNLLGLDTIQALVLSVHIFARFSPIGGSLFSMDRVWAESMATGALARAIAKAQGMPGSTVDQAFTAGLLHDIGILVLAANLFDRYNAVLQAACEKNEPSWRLERQEFRADHGEIGAYLLGLWGLSDPIVEAVAFHHRPSDCAGDTFSPLTAVHVASALQQELAQQAIGNVPSRLDTAYLEKLRLIDRLPHWREVAGTLGKETTND
jgi:HD-like signal output (HDOD) protein